MTEKTNQLKTYIEQAYTSGMGDEDIRKDLSHVGWAEADIEEALTANLKAASSSRRRFFFKPASLSRRARLGVFVSLLIAGSIGAFILFQGGSGLLSSSLLGIGEEYEVINEKEVLRRAIEARDLQRQEDLQQLAFAVRLYASSSSSHAYPTTDGILRHVEEIPCPMLTERLIPRCSADPSGPPAFYGYRSDSRIFELTAVLEDSECIIEDAVLEDGLCIYRIAGGE